MQQLVHRQRLSSKSRWQLFLKSPHQPQNATNFTNNHTQLQSLPLPMSPGAGSAVLAFAEIHR